MTQSTFIFDLDDTLVYNQYLHYRSECEWLKYAAQRFFPEDKELNTILEEVCTKLHSDGFDAKSPLQYLSIYKKKVVEPIFDIIETTSKIDIENVKATLRRGLNAFGSSRYPTSLVKAFTHFSEKFNVPFTQEDSQEVFRIGMLTFNVESSLIDGVMDTLEFLRRKKHELLVFTKGEEEVQHKKMALSGIKKYFSEIHVVFEKNQSVLRSVVGERKKTRFSW